MNQQLRSIFSQITYPSNDVLFLYDRSAKLSDSTFYSNNSSDTLIGTMWYQLYDEMYYAAHDTLPLSAHDDIENYSENYNNDTIPIAVMDYEWYYCANNSLSTGTYFIWDTINTLLYDNPTRPDWPFGQSNIFAVSPLRTTTNFLNPTFLIEPNLFFSDDINSTLYVTTTFRIDFGDGTGWHYFDPTLTNYYQANYSIKGRKDIRAELLDVNRNVVKGSNSTMNVLKDISANTADYILDMPGLQIGVYEACTDNPENERIIIYLEGIDPLDFIPSRSKGIDEIYETMIHSQYIEELRNFNYKFLVVNWKKSTIDMRFNALYVINLIEYLKREYVTSDEQFVIIGESMGGVIARYALTYMETENYQADNYTNFFVEAALPGNVAQLALLPELIDLGMENKDPLLKPLMHKTRELITIDSPHQGANVPLSIQMAYEKAIGLIFPSFKLVTNAYNIGLEAQAVRQLLIYHVRGKVNPNAMSSEYNGAFEHYTFFGQLRNLGNYPRYCKLMALSSGALRGYRQVDLAGAFRVPNDQILDFEVSYNAKILKWKLPIFGAQLKMLTNPNGTANVFKTGIGRYSFIIKLKWFGFNISTGYVGLLTDVQDAENVRAHCVSAGGFYDVPGLNAPNNNAGISSSNETWGLFGPFGNSASNYGGCLTMDETFGFNGVFGAHNLSYSLCSKGFSFGFIPLQSALDYGNGLNISLDHDIQSENINIKLSRTPFDVIMGHVTPYNQWHLDYRDEFIFNITQLPATNCPGFKPKYAYYDANLVNACAVRRSLLCLEIGDEELYLENWDLNRTAKFQAQYDVLVNARNPYYQYPGFIDPNLNMPGVYSKQNNFLITQTGYANFYHNMTNSPTGIGFSYINPQPSPQFWLAHKDKMNVCVNDYAQKSSLMQEIDENTSNGNISDETLELELVPNPVLSGHVECKIQLISTDFYGLQLTDAFGKIISKFNHSDDVKHTFITLDVSKLISGVYFVTLSNNGEHLVKRLIIQ